jgi:hypothetical protein
MSGDLTSYSPVQAAAVNAKDEPDAEEAPTADELGKLTGIAFTAAAPRGKGKSRSAPVGTTSVKAGGGRGGGRANARGRGRGRG